MKSIHDQRGGFVLGLIVGLLLGLAVALGVALYVTKVPVPLMNKVQQRTPEQDAAEAQKNRNWDPNASLAGKQSPRPQTAGPAAATGPSASEPHREPLAEGQRPPPILPPAPRGDTGTPAPAPAPVPPAAKAAPEGGSKRDPAAILSGAAPDAKAGSEANYSYWVQVGAYARPEDAEQQRAALAIQGLQAKVSQRDQNGRTVTRVRLGPFDTREEAESQRQRISATMPEASLVRVERGKP